jgi:DNA-binding transcriptional regulator YdaS (Cro superfamily)
MASTQTAPGTQSSGTDLQAAPSFLSCNVPQSQTVASVLPTPVSPARKTQWKGSRAVAQGACPVGLHASTGGVQRDTLRTGAELMSNMVITEQRLFDGQSISLRQVLKHVQGQKSSEIQTEPGAQLPERELPQSPCTGTNEDGTGAVPSHKKVP